MINEEKLVNILVIESLQKTINHYGLEGTLEAIDRVYSKLSKINFLFKKCFFENFLQK